MSPRKRKYWSGRLIAFILPSPSYAFCKARSEANRASYRVESTGKRDFPRLFKVLHNLQCQENGAPPHGRIYFGFYYIKQLVRGVKNPKNSPLNRLFCVPFLLVAKKRL